MSYTCQMLSQGRLLSRGGAASHKSTTARGQKSGAGARTGRRAQRTPARASAPPLGGNGGRAQSPERPSAVKTGSSPADVAALEASMHGSSRKIPELQDRTKAQQFLHETADMLSDYAAATDLHSGKPGALTDTPVVDLKSPEELAAAFEAAGCPLAIGQNEDPVSADVLMKAMEATLVNSVRTHHPLFFNQLYAGADPVGVAGEWLAVAANTNVFTYEVAPVFTVVEREVLAKMARKWMNVEETPTHDGLFVPGGSISNMYGLLLARHKADPMLVSRGLSGSPRLVAFCSDQAHYSFTKAAMVTGIGRDNMVGVETDIAGKMIPEKLKEAIADARASGGVPFFVCATAGTTVLGAYDPFDEIRDITTGEDMWMHVDASWGGGAFLSEKLRARDMVGAEKADSLAWNPHKMMNMPVTCSAFLTRHEGALAEANKASAAYLFQPDKNFPEMDLGDRTIQCGRRADAYKVWLAWKSKGDEQWAAEMEHADAMADALENGVRNREDRFMMATPRGCTNVGFWYIPKRLRAEMKQYVIPSATGPVDISEVPDSVLDELSAVGPKLKNLMQRSGDALIGYQVNKGLPNFWRCVFAGAKGLCAQDIEDLLDRMDALGEEL